MTDVPDPERSNTEHDQTDAALSDAVEDALKPAQHDAVMALWQRVVLGRLDRGGPPTEDEELLRRLYEGERPDDPPSS
ncbi:hypothetical protein [Actinomycetospora termitidis]|uniref:Anti-sigma factor n=1 Tax=Actinomycetospora termitidis TaxID=3053470 RepID=A0ABT7MGL8_9PSEU|nr:hypothetical protein [Actinomycetospora sp. Odt1-22]MDL5159835.1 hypothetical protein [Actinomycetospora sp. Odt1-22]